MVTSCSGQTQAGQAAAGWTHQRRRAGRSQRKLVGDQSSQQTVSAMTLTCNVLPSQKFLRKSKGPCSQPPCSFCHAWWVTTGPFDCTYLSSIASKSIASMRCNIFNSRCRSKPDSCSNHLSLKETLVGLGGGPGALVF